MEDAHNENKENMAFNPTPLKVLAVKLVALLLGLLALTIAVIMCFSFTQKPVHDYTHTWYEGHIDKVYDGDTWTANVYLGFKTYRLESLRAWGIDTPEVRGREKKQGFIVRDTVAARIFDKDVYVKVYYDKQGKFGRYLAEVFYWRNDSLINLNKQLVDEGLAKEYMTYGDKFSEPFEHYKLP